MNNIKISTAIISTSLLLSSFSLGIQAQSASAHYYHASESVAKSSMDEIKEASKKDRSETIAAVSKNLSSITKSGQTFDTARAEVFTAEGKQIIRIPVSYGQAVNNFSNLTVVLENKKVLDTIEAIVKDRIDGSESLDLWWDGKTIYKNYIGNKSPKSYSGVTVLKEDPSKPFSWSKWKDCMNDKGVSSWVVTTVAAACSAGGPATVAACAAGITGYAGYISSQCVKAAYGE